MTYPLPNETKAVDKFKQAWNENPLLVIGVLSVAARSAAKLIDAFSAFQGRKAYAKDVKRRVKGSK